MLLLKPMAIGLVLFGIGLTVERFLLGTEVTLATLMGFIVLACIFANTFGWWFTSPFDVGDIHDLRDGHYAVLHVSVIRRKVSVVPVKQTMSEVAYEQTGKPFWLTEDELWARTKGIRFNCSITTHPAPNSP